MKLYLGVTDLDWFNYLANLNPPPEDINFWQPGGSQVFKVLKPGEPFLFKLKAPYHAIGGIGFFASYSRLPLSISWDTFQERNGCDSLFQFRQKIMTYRRRFGNTDPNPIIGCIVLNSPVFFQKEDWIKVPPSWSKNIVQGKSYSTADAEGKALWSRVYYTLNKYKWLQREVETKSPLLAKEPDGPEYKEVISRIRVGQGAFRVMITDAYSRRCAISGERTLPALEAAHIKPYALSGPHLLSNGLLLRSDLHKLFDSGYLTVNSQLEVEISKRIREEFENGRDYYKYHGKKLLVLPQNINDQPDEKYICWHNENVFNE